MSAVRIRPVTDIADKLAAATSIAPRWRWYHGLAFYVIIQVLTFATSALVSVAANLRAWPCRWVLCSSG